MAKAKRPKLLHKSATQNGELMAKPVGLMQRGNSWGLRVRVPDHLRSKLGKSEVWKSFGAVSYRDACRFARFERAAVDRRFAEAEAELRTAPPPPLTDIELYELARAFLHKMEADAGPLPVLRADRQAELEAVEETAGLVGQSIEDASLQRVAKAFARWAGRRAEDGDPDFLRICEAVQLAWLEQLDRRAHRLEGRDVRTIDPLFAGVDGAKPLAAPLTVAAAIRAYKDDPERAGVSASTRKAWMFRFRVIEELLGPNRLIGTLTRDDIRAMRDALMKMPANAPKLFPGMSIAQATAAAERVQSPALSPKSVTLYIELASSLFAWLEREEMVARNPARALRGPPGSKEKPRRPLTPAEAEALLSATAPPEEAEADWTYWMVRIAILSGMRLGEIAGLAVGDVQQVDGVWVFDVRPNEHRDLKTAASTRLIPIHPRLIEAGLLDLRSGRGQTELLLKGAPATGGTSNAAQKKIGRLVRSIIADRRASFHSLRHGFRDALRDAGVPQDITARLGGWTMPGSSAMESYGAGHSTDTLSAWINKLSIQSRFF